MRIAYVCADPGIPVFGRKGASVHVQEVTRAMRRRGAEVLLLTPRPGGQPPTGLEDLAVHELPLPSGPLVSRERAALVANTALDRALEARGHFDLIYERYSLWSWAGMAHARDRGVPGVLEVNAPLIEEQDRHRGLADRVAVERVAASAFADAAAVVAVSPPVAAWVAACGGRRERIHVVPNGVDPSRFRLAAPWTGRGACTVGFVGTLKPWHDLTTLVDAFRLLVAEDPTGWRLVVVGDGPERAALAARLADAGLDTAISLTGAVTPADVPDCLARMHVGVAPYGAGSDYFSPLKVLEYLAAGLAVVASDVGQIRELLRSGEVGILTPPGDAAALAAALARLRADPGRCAALGTAGRAEVEAERTWDTVVGRILSAAGLPGAAQEAA